MSKKIFIVEDDALTAIQLRHCIESFGYQFCGTADNGESALEQIRSIQPDLVLMDIRLNGAMDGIAVAARLHAESTIAIIYITAYAADDLLIRARLTEPFGYLLKPFNRQELKSCIEIGLYKNETEHRQQRIFDAVAQTITKVVKLHDPFLNDVQGNAARLASAIATELHLPSQEIMGIRIAALLHGIGLSGLPATLLNPLTPLQGPEMKLFQTHPEIAFQLLKDIEFPYPVAEMVYQHMERLDGSGFPRGLSHDAILPGSRVVAVACQVARMLTPHGMEPAVSVADTLKELENGSGTLFDANIVAACVRLFKEKGFTFSFTSP